jgi:uncharacterized membrane protein YraQ (UPF0718 family)
MSIFGPVQALADWLTYSVFSLDKGSKLAGSVDFFIFDTIKILILLATIIFVVSLIRSYFPPEKTKKYLSNHRFPIVNNLLAAMVGIVTPFCSCSAVPLFIGFVEAGVPLGATFSFLISSPMVTIATVAGYVMGKLRLEKWVEEYVYQFKAGQTANVKMSFKDRLSYAKVYMIDILKKVWPYIIVGVGLGAFIHGYAPNDLLAKYAGPGNPFAVLVAVLVGIPLYSNAAGTLPIVSVLIEKGMTMGTALAFMMAVTALSLPEFIILRRVLKPKLIITYASIVGVGIIFIGYLFNGVIR